jgi:hypothetical protein
MKNLNILCFLACLLISTGLNAEIGSGAKKFAQLEPILPTPNVYRTASGAPGSSYWQQKVDYDIKVSLDESLRRITGTETVRYQNNSPDTLQYLWVQLDQNRFADDSIYRSAKTQSRDRVSFQNLREAQSYEDTEYGHEINRVADTRGNVLPYTISGTMMRIDLPKPLAPGKDFSFEVDWAFNITDEVAIGGRSGYEHFTDNDTGNDTYIFFLAQWFPRMAAYTDYTGWQNKQFIRRGEFTLEFGDYMVEITVPADHIVSATGTLQNSKEVLTETQRQRLAAANADQQVFIVSAEEAKENELEGTTDTKTWRFKADNVRDFAFASSRKFIWDAMIHEQPGAEQERVLAMSFYPNEAEPIWSHYSTHAVVHTMDVYSRFSFDYPYPTAQSVNTWASGGMEYPMISFNGYRPEQPKKDEDSEENGDSSTEEITYSSKTKYGLIGVIIHEIGHIYFPMIVNSDERRWTWMDEGLNSFLEYIAELEWEESYPTHSNYTNVLDYITEYMTSERQVPIMTQSESILQFGPNAYSKPAAALVVLRETVMGRELFDFAFKQYAERWKFKRPTPADFFRTMEDASAVDLDWFWRGWFYSTDHVDVSIDSVRYYKIASQNPEIDHPVERQIWHREHPAPVSEKRNRESGLTPRIDRVPGLKDFYNENDRFTVSNKDRNEYDDFIEGLKEWERLALERALAADQHIYFVDFSNIGGLVTPLPLTIDYQDGSSRSLMVPAEVWRTEADEITQLFIEDKPIERIHLDDGHQTADADYSNNQYPPKFLPSQLEVYKRDRKTQNLMKDMLVELKSADKEESKAVPLTSPEG